MRAFISGPFLMLTSKSSISFYSSDYLVFCRKAIWPMIMVETHMDMALSRTISIRKERRERDEY